MHYRKYEGYKKTESELIDYIPESWEVCKFKYISRMLYGDSLDKNSRSNNGIYKVYGSNGIVDYCDKSNTLKENIIIGRKGSYGKINFSKEKGFVIDTAYYIDSRCTKENIRWLYYLMQVMELDKYSQDTGVPGLSREYTYNIKVCKCSQNEQKKIVEFLDEKILEIDCLVGKKEKLIDLLKEKREAIITEAVTKGVDKNVEMKDSGVQWIGVIPESWNISKIKYSTYVKGRIGWQGLKSEEFIDEGPYLVTGTDFENGKIDWNKCYHISEERYNEAIPIQLRENDLLITKDGTIGKIAIVTNKPNKAILNSGIFVTRCLNSEYYTEFMYFVLNSKVFSNYIKYMETGSTIKHLYQETFENFKYMLPNKSEQMKIVDYIKNKVKNLDEIMKKITLEINLLNEYKKSLITEVVTGKIDVRNYEE